MDIEEVLASARAKRAVPAPQVRRAIRLAAGLTQDQIASVVGCSRAEVSRWESGKRSPGRFLASYVALLMRLATEAAA